MAPALAEALALARAPRRARPGPAERLPEGMLSLLKLAAGEEQASESARESSRESAEALREAAVFYIQQVMFADGSNSYRVLGVDADASEERMREHFRWLTRWLHPDRNADQWEAVYADRVNRAWQNLRSPERRSRYDEGLSGAPKPAEAEYRQPAPLKRPPIYFEEPAPPSGLRWLPTTILSALGLGAVGLVSLLYALQLAEQEPRPDPPPEAPLAIAAPAAPAQVEIELPAPPMPAPARPIAAESQPIVLEPAALPEMEPTEAETLVAAPSPVPSRPVVERAAPAAPPRIAKSEPVAEIRAPAPPPPTPVVAVVEKPTPSPSPAVRAPVSLPAERASRPTPDQAAQPQIDERDANRVLGHFSRAYSDGDLAGMRALFTADVRSPRGGLEHILSEYNQLFAGSLDRSLAMRDVSWFASGGTLTIIASYQATVTTTRSRRPRRTQGDLRLDLRRVDEQWRIYRLQHGERRG